MKQKFIDYYMDVAERTSRLSSAIRRQVGAVIVKDNRILSYGYNGMPTGWDNTCENKEYMPGDNWDGQLYPHEEYDKEVESNRRYRLITRMKYYTLKVTQLLKCPVVQNLVKMLHCL